MGGKYVKFIWGKICMELIYNGCMWEGVMVVCLDVRVFLRYLYCLSFLFYYKFYLVNIFVDNKR